MDKLIPRPIQLRSLIGIICGRLLEDIKKGDVKPPWVGDVTD